MSIAARLKWYLSVHRVPYEVIASASVPPPRVSDGDASVPRRKLARAELLHDEQGYVMPVLRADHDLDLEKLRRRLGRSLCPVAAAEAATLFFDCEAGSIPAVGSAYGIPTIVDESLVGQGDVYFEAGDHADLVHLAEEHFFRLLEGAACADLSLPECAASR
jgi:Ala-tRNA(Pro) deacylase